MCRRWNVSGPTQKNGHLAGGIPARFLDGNTRAVSESLLQRQICDEATKCEIHHRYAWSPWPGCWKGINFRLNARLKEREQMNTTSQGSRTGRLLNVRIISCCCCWKPGDWFVWIIMCHRHCWTKVAIYATMTEYLCHSLSQCWQATVSALPNKRTSEGIRKEWLTWTTLILIPLKDAPIELSMCCSTDWLFIIMEHFLFWLLTKNRSIIMSSRRWHDEWCSEKLIWRLLVIILKICDAVSNTRR